MSKRDELLKVVGYVVQPTCRSCANGHGFKDGAVQGRCSEHDEVVSVDGMCPSYQRALASFDGANGDLKYATDIVGRRVEQIVALLNGAGPDSLSATDVAEAMVTSLASTIGANNSEVIRLRSIIAVRRARLSGARP